jgi:6-phosphogluconate dehydrogenase (decarboxylating)
MREHILKTIECYWDALADGTKTFEVRRNDRFFQKGDTLILRKITEYGGYVSTGTPMKFHDLHFEVTCILQGGQHGIEPGYCVMGLKEVKP